MNLYLIQRRGGMPNQTWDEWISAVVAAETPEDASTIHPGGSDRWSPCEAWVSFDQVDVQFVGVAAPGTERGVVHNSWNAG
jgi:hypothetical protein